jgi:predicted metalloprotease
MKWSRGHDSSDVIDTRGQGRARGGVPNMGGLPLPKGKGGLAILLVFVVVMALGGSQCLGGSGGTSSSSSDFDITDIFNQVPTGIPQEERSQDAALDGSAQPDDELTDFTEFVFDDVQDAWEGAFPAGEYDRAQAVLYDGSTESGCGFATSEVGPFYCPADQRVYLDLTFFEQLSSQFGAPGDFAIAYVIAHEVGHHVQNLTGTNEQVQRESQANPDEANALSVRLELQADCLAGVWAQSVYDRDLLEEGDLEEALQAAEAVGDDTLQEQSGGSIDQDRWTHGSAEQRQRWFDRGFDGGSTEACDTFAADSL